MRLFADNTIVYLTIKSHASAQSLQEDLHNLELWEKEWSMEFNPDKCEVFPYTLNDTTLRTTEININQTIIPQKVSTNCIFVQQF